MSEAEQEDQVIIDGLMKIRTGILERDISAVCEGYSYITGEEISPPEDDPEPPKSKIERIREAFSQTNEEKDGSQEEQEIPLYDQLAKKKVDELKEELEEDFGYTGGELKGYKKKDLINLIIDAKESEQDGYVGKVNSRDDKGMTVITGEESEFELNQNKKAPKTPRGQDIRKTSMKNFRSQHGGTRSEVEKRGFRFFDKPER